MSSEERITVNVGPGEAAIVFSAEEIYLVVHPADQDTPVGDLPYPVQNAMAGAALYLPREDAKEMLRDAWRLSMDHLSNVAEEKAKEDEGGEA